MAVSRTNELVFGGMFTALMAVGAFIKVMLPIGPFLVTFSLQFLFALLAGVFLGDKKGVLCVLTYLIIGLLGIPVFAHGGGIGYILKPTFGFLIGFAAAAFVCGRVLSIQSKQGFLNILISAFCGEMVYYLCGLIYYYFMFNYYIGGNDPIGITELIRVWFLSTVAADFGLCVLASLLSVRLLPVFRRINGL